MTMTNKTAPRSRSCHPDAAQLGGEKADGLRALYLYAAARQNDDVARLVSGSDPQMAHRVDDLLLPVVKGGSDAPEDLTERADLRRIGLFGTIRSSTSAMPRSTRSTKTPPPFRPSTSSKDHARPGEALTLASQISHTIDTCDAGLKQQAEQLRTALEDVKAMTATLTGYLMSASENPTRSGSAGLGRFRSRSGTCSSDSGNLCRPVSRPPR
jgi:hypothetical protein